MVEVVVIRPQPITRPISPTEREQPEVPRPQPAQPVQPIIIVNPVSPNVPSRNEPEPVTREPIPIVRKPIAGSSAPVVKPEVPPSGSPAPNIHKPEDYSSKPEEKASKKPESEENSSGSSKRRKLKKFSGAGGRIHTEAQIDEILDFWLMTGELPNYVSDRQRWSYKHHERIPERRELLEQRGISIVANIPGTTGHTPAVIPIERAKNQRKTGTGE